MHVEDSPVLRFQKGEPIYNEGETCLGLYVVRSGLVGIRKQRRGGRSELVRLVGPGEALAFGTVIAAQAHRESAEALRPSEIRFIDKSTCYEVLLQQSDLGRGILRAGAATLDELETRLHEPCEARIGERLLRVLLTLAGEEGRACGSGGLTIKIPVNRADLATLLGVRRETISRALHELADKGLARFIDRHHIEVCSGARNLLRLPCCQGVGTGAAWP